MKKDRSAKLFIEELQKLPIIELACKKVGISRQTVYRWRDEDDAFRKEMENALKSGKGVINEMAKSQLIAGIKAGDFRFIKLWLSHNDEDFISPEWRFEKSLEKSGQYLTLADFMRAGVKEIEEKKAKMENQDSFPDYPDDISLNDSRSDNHPSKDHSSELLKVRSENKKGKTDTSRQANIKRGKGSADKA